MYSIFALFAYSIYLCASALFYSLFFSLCVCLSFYVCFRSPALVYRCNCNKFRTFSHSVYAFCCLRVCRALFLTVRFVSITFPGADADCFAMCAACARGDSFLRSRQAGRQGRRRRRSRDSRSYRGQGPLHTTLTHFRLRFASFCLVSFDCRRLRRTLSMMGNDGLTLTETLLYPYPLTSIRSCLPACLPGCLTACVCLSVCVC